VFEPSHLQHNPISGYIQIVSDGHHLPAFWSHPDLGGPFPGLVLLHDHWGLTPHIRSQARRFAEVGYYVIAPDLFNRQVATSPVQAVALREQLGPAAGSRVTATIHALTSHIRCNGQVGMIGWGMGAEQALRTAVYRDDLHALVIFYGLPDDLTPAELRMLCCPLLALFGQADPSVPAEAIDQLRAALAATGTEHEVIVYEGAERDFFNDSHAAFAPTVAERAWNRALAFLAGHLSAPVPGESGPEDDPPPFEPGEVY
jgi:carboxymethylenebutenolidase